MVVRADRAYWPEVADRLVRSARPENNKAPGLTRGPLSVSLEFGAQTLLLRRRRMKPAPVSATNPVARRHMVPGSGTMLLKRSAWTLKSPAKPAFWTATNFRNL